jgi:nickel-dependent lactate racemase
MTTVQMKYGATHLDVTVADENLIDIIHKPVTASALTEEDEVRRALAAPIGSPRLRELVRPGQTVAVLVSDVTRLWHRPWVYLHLLVQELSEAGIPDASIRFIGAVGTHRKQTREEHEKILGPVLSPRFQIDDHDAWDASNLKTVGVTPLGTRVTLNRRALECDHLVLTGCCTYHPFFGWGGGKKSVVPGIAAFETVQQNHLRVMAEQFGGGQRPECRNGNVAGNPAHEDAIDAAKLIQPSFLLNVIMGYDGQITRAVAGHWEQAHDAGCRIVTDLYGVGIPELADLAIASQGGFPKDIEFYQTGKAIYNALDAVKPGGTLIVLSECREGLGPADARRIFVELPTMDAREADVRALFTVPKYVCWYMCHAATRYDVIVVSSVAPELLKATKIRVVPTLEQALALVKAERGDRLRTYLIPLGSAVLPILEQRPA